MGHVHFTDVEVRGQHAGVRPFCPVCSGDQTLGSSLLEAGSFAQ